MDAVGALNENTDPPVNSTPKLRPRVNRPTSDNNSSMIDREYHSFCRPTKSTFDSPR
jgi:hypothetical protein